MSIESIVSAQRAYFAKSETLDIAFRKAALKKLRSTLLARENEINAALYNDLNKSPSESYMCELGMTLAELNYVLAHLDRWARRHPVLTPLAQFHARSFTVHNPYGVVLIMSPWNYPFMLTMEPLIGALAAGNCCVVKPSAYAPATSAVIREIISSCFPAQYVCVVEGGRRENQALLDQRFDYIFFTGGVSVGREVMRKAAEHLTPVSLELGGKSPCIVDSTAKIRLAAKRIVWGKFLNCGQTCVAPDYILCHSSIKDRLVHEIAVQINRQFGELPLTNPNYGKIVNEKHFERLCGLIDPEKTVHGGQTNRETLQIAPTVMDKVTWDDAVMQEEIFGPVLPVLTYEKLSDIIDLLAEKPKPLAFYIFSENKTHIRTLTSRCSFGGGCVNDVVIHLATSEMGFGGVGESGMGSYHGREGFDVFSHSKSIVDKKTWMDLPMRYQPYKKVNEKLLHLFLK